MAVTGYEISELTETLDRLEQELLEFERRPASDPSQGELVHFIFRFAHNLKSALGMVHRQHCSQLIHSVESNFDRIRNGKAVSTPELVTLSLLSIDQIRKNLESETEDGERLDELRDCLKTVSERLPSPEGVKRLSSLGWNWDNYSQSVLAGAFSDYGKLYLLEKTVRRSLTEEQFRSLPVFEDILCMGKIVRIYPDFETLRQVPAGQDPEKSEAVIQTLFASSAEPSVLAQTLFDPFKPIEYDLAQETRPSATALLPLLHFRASESPTPLPSDRFLVRHFRDAEELAAMAAKREAGQIAVIESDRLKEILGVLSALTAQERASGLIPGSLLPKIVLSSALSEADKTAVFLERCDLILPQDIDSIRLREELGWLEGANAAN